MSPTDAARKKEKREKWANTHGTQCCKQNEEKKKKRENGNANVCVNAEKEQREEASKDNKQTIIKKKKCMHACMNPSLARHRLPISTNQQKKKHSTLHREKLVKRQRLVCDRAGTIGLDPLFNQSAFKQMSSSLANHRFLRNLTRDFGFFFFVSNEVRKMGWEGMERERRGDSTRTEHDWCVCVCVCDVTCHW